MLLRLKRRSRFRIGGFKVQRRRVLDHLVVLLADQFRVYGFRQDWLQVGIGIGLTALRTRELLTMQPFEAWQQVEAQERTEGEGDLTLPMAVHMFFSTVISVLWWMTSCSMEATSEEEQVLSWE